MPDIIQLLPDHIANQIAAGEVIQRPASAVKEMLENAIDAGAKHIHLIIKDSGKELIQVNDDGKGMSLTDARMSLERHATSKISTIDDLFMIRTMGFRGEALASIAAVAQVELKTKRGEDEVGTRLVVEHSRVLVQEPCSMNTGTQLAVRNLFFNVPARRNFLKSPTTETRHIIDEFTRVALAFPEVNFRFTNNQSDIFHLDEGKLKLRILNLLGNSLNNKLVPIEEDAGFIQLHGFISTPDAASRTRGHQFFFVNNRFIRSAYLNHAIKQAYKELLGKDEFPLFVIFMNIDPKRVDINVHPTKQEIKFEEEKMIYAVIHAATKHALSKYSLAPQLDFTLDPEITKLTAVTQPFHKQTQEATKTDYLFQSFTEKGKAHFLERKEEVQHWKELYKVQDGLKAPDAAPSDTEATPRLQVEEQFRESFLQINQSYIIATTKSGCLFINQHLAHERILYERYEKTRLQPITIQKCLIPIQMEVSAVDAIMLESILEELLNLGFELESFGQHHFIIQGVPADIKPGDEKASIERLMESFKHFASDVKLDKREKLLRLAAAQRAIPEGKKLGQEEMQQLFQQLLLCEQPQFTPSGKKIFARISGKDIERMIQHG
jgi:DNA mismatch repair protein MutL